MDDARPILRVGLTGGIASGKTTVARILAELGAFVLDADELAREVMVSGTDVHTRILARFGDEIADDNGQIVRLRLAQRVFRDAEDREALNAIVHPEVKAEKRQRRLPGRRAAAPGSRASPVGPRPAARSSAGRTESGTAPPAGRGTSFRASSRRSSDRRS